MRRLLGGAFVVLLLALAVVFTIRPPVSVLDPGGYDTTTVTVEDANGTQLATVDTRIADTLLKQRIGLSRTDSLANGSGMLFVHDREATHEYVMRNMSFPLDIIFVADNGTIMEIHHAPVDGDGPYPGYGRYVLEVPRGWANATGVTVGDTVRVPDA